MVRIFTLVVTLVLLAGCARTLPGTPSPQPKSEEPVRLTGVLSTNVDDAATAVTLNQDDEVFVAGVQASFIYENEAYGSSESYNDTFVRGFVARFEKETLQLRWSTLLDFPCPAKNPSEDIGTTCNARITDLALDQESNSYVLAEVVIGADAIPGRVQSYLHKFGPGGALLWRKPVSNTADGRPLGLAVTADGMAYLAWQVFTRPADPERSSTFAGFKLNKFGAMGDLLWEVDLELQRPYEGTEPYYLDIADVALLGETVVVADFARVQAFGPDGTLRWQTVLENAPTDTAVPENGERFYTHTEVAVGNAHVYVLRSSQEYQEMSGLVQPRAEVTVLGTQGAMRWGVQLGDEVTGVTNANLAAGPEGRLYLAGTARALRDDPLLQAGNFLRTYSPQGALVEALTVEPYGVIHDLAAPYDPLNSSAYLVGAMGSDKGCALELGAGCINFDAFLAEVGEYLN